MQRNSTNGKSTIGPLRWQVPSTTRPGITHEVAAMADGRLVCNCEAGMNPKARGCCWHIPAVAAGLAGKPRLRYCPKPAAGRLPVDELPIDDLYPR